MKLRDPRFIHIWYWQLPVFPCYLRDRLYTTTPEQECCAALHIVYIVHIRNSTPKFPLLSIGPTLYIIVPISTKDLREKCINKLGIYHTQRASICLSRYLVLINYDQRIGVNTHSWARYINMQTCRSVPVQLPYKVFDVSWN